MRCFGFARMGLFGLVGCAAIFANATDFQLIVTQTPPGSNPSDWKEVLRYNIAGTFGAATPLANIPTSQVFDPASPVFRTNTELLIGNRHGNQGPGSISRFSLDVLGNPTYTGNFTGNGLSDVHQIAINPVTGELFCANLNNGVSRFIFDSAGNVLPHGQHPLGVLRGIGISRDGGNMYLTRASGEILRYRLNADGSITYISSLFPPGGTSLHFIKFRADGEMYASDIYANRIFRYRFNALNDPVYVGFVSSNSPIDTAFSPDGQEMYASSHFAGGVRRYTYDSGTDTWTETATLPTISLGGIATRQEINLAPGTIAGNLQLQSFGADPSGFDIDVDILSGGSVVESHVVHTDIGGNFSLSTSLRGTFQLAAKSAHWLRRIRPEEFVLDNVKGVSGVNLSLPNGDVDGDNEVSLADYGLLSSAFGSGPGDGNWIPAADLDGDEEVTLADYGILAANFGQAGD